MDDMMTPEERGAREIALAHAVDAAKSAGVWTHTPHNRAQVIGTANDFYNFLMGKTDD